MRSPPALPEIRETMEKTCF